MNGEFQHAYRLVVTRSGAGKGVPVFPSVREREPRGIGEAVRGPGYDTIGPARHRNRIAGPFEASVCPTSKWVPVLCRACRVAPISCSSGWSEPEKALEEGDG